jgi:hypothetical protein
MHLADIMENKPQVNFPVRLNSYRLTINVILKETSAFNRTLVTHLQANTMQYYLTIKFYNHKLHRAVKT